MDDPIFDKPQTDNDLEHAIKSAIKDQKQNINDSIKSIRLLRREKKILNYFTWKGRMRRAVVSLCALGSVFAGGIYANNIYNDNTPTAKPVIEHAEKSLEKKVIKLPTPPKYKKPVKKVPKSVQKPSTVPEYSNKPVLSKTPGYRPSDNKRPLVLMYQKPRPSKPTRVYPKTTTKTRISPVIPNIEFWYFPVRGDSLSRISHQVSGKMSNWQKIQEYNGLRSETIEVNQPLKIPDSIIENTRNLYKGTVPSKFYHVKEGENWKDIAQKVCGHSGCIDKLISYNKKFNPRFSRNIYAKEFILVPK